MCKWRRSTAQSACARSLARGSTRNLATYVRELRGQGRAFRRTGWHTHAYYTCKHEIKARPCKHTCRRSTAQSACAPSLARARKHVHITLGDCVVARSGAYDGVHTPPTYTQSCNQGEDNVNIHADEAQLSRDNMYNYVHIFPSACLRKLQG